MSVFNYSVRISLALAVLACGPSDAPEVPEQPSTSAPSELRPTPAPSAPQPADHLPVSVPRSVAELDTLVGGLATFPGELAADWDFVGDHRTFAALMELSDSNPALADTAVARLVDCMGRMEPSAMTFEGRTVPVGIVCHRALKWVAYHEETGPDGGLVGTWAGDVPVNASPEALRAAQRAWRVVVRQRTYSFP
jgi:hypothetical protein